MFTNDRLFSFSVVSSCDCSTGKSTTPPTETFYTKLMGSEHASPPSLVDKELVFELAASVEPGD